MLILGGGITGLSFAYFYHGNSILLEKEPVLGGLARSYQLNNISYDLGPHIIFSHHQDILALHCSLTCTTKLKRTSAILYHGCIVKYPFENGLASLPEQDKLYCLKTFLHNPYKQYQPTNFLQFFLVNFGEGITKLYLQSYNEKIWKLDPAYLDTQMVARIPKPPKEDIVKSANGIETEGYLHQLYFHYPQTGGFQSIIDAYVNHIKQKTTIHRSTQIQQLEYNNNTWTLIFNQ